MSIPFLPVGVTGFAQFSGDGSGGTAAGQFPGSDFVFMGPGVMEGNWLTDALGALFAPLKDYGACATTPGCKANDGGGTFPKPGQQGSDSACFNQKNCHQVGPASGKGAFTPSDDGSGPGDNQGLSLGVPSGSRPQDHLGSFGGHLIPLFPYLLTGATRSVTSPYGGAGGGDPFWDITSCDPQSGFSTYSSRGGHHRGIPAFLNGPKPGGGDFWFPGSW